MSEAVLLETDVWLWKLVWSDSYNMRSTILHPSFHDNEEGVIKEIEGQIGGTIIIVISKTPLYEREGDEVLCVPQR